MTIPHKQTRKVFRSGHNLLKKATLQNLKLLFPVTLVTGFFSQFQSWSGFPACFLLIYIDNHIYLSTDSIPIVHFIAFSGKAATEPSRQNTEII